MIISFLLSFGGISYSMIIFSFAALLSTLFSVVLLARAGTTIRTKHWLGIKISLGLILLGVVFKVLHLIGADVLYLIGSAGVALFYLAAFRTKPQYNALDYLKLVWLLSHLFTTALIVLNQIPSIYSQIPLSFLVLAVIQFNSYSNNNKEYERLYKTAKF